MGTRPTRVDENGVPVGDPVGIITSAHLRLRLLRRMHADASRERFFTADMIRSIVQTRDALLRQTLSGGLRDGRSGARS